MYKTKDKLIEAIYKAMPYADQIKDLDLTKSENHIYFTWRENRFKVSLDGYVGTIHGCMEHGCDLSILFAKLLKIEWVKTL